MRYVAFLILVSVVGAHTASADSMLCVGRNGSLHLRGNGCRSKEHAFDLGTLPGLIAQGPKGDPGPTGPPGPAGAQGIPGSVTTNGLVVRDSRGYVVGPVVSVEAFTPTIIVRRVNDTLLSFGVTGHGFASASSTPQIYFEDSACTGTPLLLTGAGADLPLVRPVIMAGGAAFYPSGTPTERIRKATAYPVDSAAGCTAGTYLLPGLCCQSQPPSPPYPLAEAATLQVSTLGLLPPFVIDGL